MAECGFPITSRYAQQMPDSPGSWFITGVMGFFIAIFVVFAFTRRFSDELRALTRKEPYFRWARWLMAFFGIGTVASAIWQDTRFWLWRVGLAALGITYTYIAWRLFQNSRTG
jgi:hypothetical protein